MPNRRKSPTALAAAGEKRVQQSHLKAEVDSLARRLLKLERAHDINTGVFSDTMKMLETRMNVVQDVLSMLHDEGSGLVTAEDGRIDFNYYTQKYLERLVRLEEKPAPTPDLPAIVTPDDEDPIIFGGTTP